jgi:hypothetical protein
VTLGEQTTPVLPQLSQQRTNATERNTIFETAGMFAANCGDVHLRAFDSNEPKPDYETNPI